jgi:hypothetical protein
MKYLYFKNSEHSLCFVFIECWVFGVDFKRCDKIYALMYGFVWSNEIYAAPAP